MTAELSPSARRVQEHLTSRGFRLRVTELPASTRTVAEAARAVGCDTAQIVKSLVFRGTASGDAVLVVASGANRVDEKKIAALVGEPIGKADADFVRQATGFAIGGVPPVGHVRPLRTVMDEDLLLYGEIWAAAGTPHAVFSLTPAQLRELSAAMVAQVKPDAPAA